MAACDPPPQRIRLAVTSAETGVASTIQPRGSLRSRFLRASSWLVAAHGGTLVLRLASSLVLTRLLTPEAFGLMSVVTTVGIIISLLSDIGIRQAVIQSKDGDDPLMLNTAWAMQIIRGLFIWLVCCAVGLFIYVAQQAGYLTGASVYASPELPLLMALTTLSGVIASTETTKRFTADRRIDQKRVVFIELASMAVGLAVSMGLAWMFRSVWAVVIGGWVTALASTVAGHLWLAGPPNRWAWDHAYARQMFTFGKWILASSLLYAIANNSDKLLLGAWVTSTVMGCYAIGQNLAMVLELAMGRIIAQVTLPTFSDVARSSPERMREVYLRLRLSFDSLFLGAAGMLFVLGPSLVGLMYDERYAEAGVILQILSFSLLSARYGVSGMAYMALNAPHALAVLSLTRLLSFFILVPAAYYTFGLHAAFWAIALHPLATVPLIWWFDRRHGLWSWRHETMVLAAWPVGWILGLVVASALGGWHR